MGTGSASGTTAQGAGSQASPSEWPAHFPACCPPVRAQDARGTVYLLVANDPPAPQDFLSAKERGAFKSFEECRRSSLSCGITLDYIIELRDSVSRLGEHHVASATLTAADGKIEQTGAPGHHSLWLRLMALQNAPSVFKVLP
jgi:hypothetical protein